MGLGTSDVEIAYNTYRNDPTNENLQAFIRSKPRDPNEELEKEEYMKMIQDSLLPWDKRLEKHLSQTKNQILLQLCKDNLINHLSGNNKFQLVSKLVTHFHDKPGEWKLDYSDRKYKIIKTESDPKTDTGEEVQEEVQEKEGEVHEEVQKPIEEVQMKVQNNKKSTGRSTNESTKTDRRSTDESTLKPIDLRLNNEIKLILKEEANNQGLTQYLSDLVLKKQHISFECFEKISTILSTKPKKDARIQFKVPSEKKEELQEEAKKKDITLTKHLFQIILHNMKDTRTVKSTNTSTDASTSNQNNHKDPVERLNLKNRKLEAKVEKLQKEKKLLEEILKQIAAPFIEEEFTVNFKTDEQKEKVEKIMEDAFKNA